MIFDSHAHYEDKRFAPDRDELLCAMRENNIGRIVNVGSTLDTSKQSVELAGQYEDIYAAVGIHPSEVAFPIDGEERNALSIKESVDVIPEVIKELKNLSTNRKCVSIGEIGLDYYWDKEEDNHNLQKQWFKVQLELASRVNKPVIVHSREASKDTFDILKEAKSTLDTRAVVHCYSGSPEMAKEYVKLGYYIGVGGVVTFKNGRKLRETVEEIPLESILVETDCPYMAPEPYRGKRNDSTKLSYIVERISNIKNISKEQVEEITWQNACSFYGIGM
ncbi:MAG: TatD family deoxyribonuclease [Lachnospiraceae bacterium]|nr:TatD family deoxyribonuclease [Lachnospiraceae bacterium]